MKPGFALRLDHDAVSLLVRVTEGWAELGRADIGDPGFEDQLIRLREQAGELAPDGFATKLILPADQILYSDIDAPGPDDTARRAQIAAALEGRTPYAVDDLVFDWSGSGRNLSVAVVARLTLDEAEDFAESQGFNPVTFVAMPEPGQFSGEPFFGPTTNAAAHLPAGEGPVRDREPVRIVTAPLPVPQTAAPPDAAPGGEEPFVEAAPPVEAEPDRTAQGDPGDESGVEATPELDATAVAAKAAVGTDALPADTPDAEETPADSDPDSPAQGDTEKEIRAEETPEPKSPQPDAPGATPEDAAETETPSPPPQPATPPDDAPEVDVTPVDAAPPVEAEAETSEDTPKPHRGGLGITEGLVPDAAAELSETDLVMAEAADPLDDDLEDELGPEPGAADAEAPFIAVDDLPEIDDIPDPPPGVPVAPAFSTRRVGPAASGGADAPQTADKAGLPPAPAATRDPVEQGVAEADLPVPANDEAPPPDVRPLRGRKLPQQGKMPDARHGTAAQLRAERAIPEPKRGEEGAAPFALPVPPAPRNRVRLGLAIILVSALVLFMAAVSLWSFWFADAPDPEAEREVAAAAPAPDTAEPPAAPATTPEPQLSTGSPATEAAPVDPPADGTIWADSPAGPATPATDATGAPVISDATAPDLAVTETGPLAPPAEAAADAALPLQPLPPPFGTEFDFRPDGLIRATAEGVVTPDGITLYAGRPPVVPEPRPAAIAPAPAEAAPADDGAADPETAAPEDNDASAVPAADGAADAAEAAPLPPPVDPAHAALKPRARPGAVVTAAAERAAREAAEAEALAQAIASATPQAVATSQRPKARPKGLARVVTTPAVDDAVAAAMASSIAATVPTPAPAPAPAAAPSPPEEIDEPEPVAPTPNIPTSTTVAKQATIKNAINLRNINLIGVYGSSSSRRALIRMGNGRYVKVKIGDRLDGGQVAAIGDRELSYVKRGRTIVLKIEGGS